MVILPRNSGISAPAYGKSGEISAELDDYIRLGGFPVVHTATCVEPLDRIVRFVFDNTGNAFSAQSAADYFKSQYRRPDLETVYAYLKALEAAFIIKRVPRYDVIGRVFLP